MLAMNTVVCVEKEEKHRICRLGTSFIIYFIDSRGLRVFEDWNTDLCTIEMVVERVQIKWMANHFSSDTVPSVKPVIFSVVCKLNIRRQNVYWKCLSYVLIGNLSGTLLRRCKSLHKNNNNVWIILYFKSVEASGSAVVSVLWMKLIFNFTPSMWNENKILDLNPINF